MWLHQLISFSGSWVSKATEGLPQLIIRTSTIKCLMLLKRAQCRYGPSGMTNRSSYEFHWLFTEIEGRRELVPSSVRWPVGWIQTWEQKNDQGSYLVGGMILESITTSRCHDYGWPDSCRVSGIRAETFVSQAFLLWRSLLLCNHLAVTFCYSQNFSSD